VNRYQVGQKLTDKQVAELTAGKAKAGWYDAANGQRVYICDGCHRDGFFGFKVLDLGGLK
jgi:hypothetical protein